MPLKETQAIIERVTLINETHQRLHLSVDPHLLSLKAGQSLLVRSDGQGFDPYLRERWFPVAIGKNEVVVERPLTSRYEPGGVISVIAPIGQPYRFRKQLRNVLFIACDTEPTPLVMPMLPLLINRVSVTLLLLGRAADYHTQHLPPEVEVLHGEADWTWPNRVTTVGWSDQAFIVAPPAEETAYFARALQVFRELRAEIVPQYLLGVFQSALPCGVGACGACLVRMKGGDPAYACTDGPALDLTLAGL